MKDLSPRAIRGAIFLAIGISALQAEPIVTRALSGSSIWSGLSMTGLSLTGLVCNLAGIYFLATRYKK